MKRYQYNREYEQAFSDEKGVDWELLKRLLGYLRPYRYLLGIAILFLVIAKGIEAFIPIYLGDIMQRVFDQLEGYTSLLRGCLWAFGLLVLGYSLDAGNVVMKSWVAQKGLYTLRTEVYQHIQHLPMRYYDRHAVGKMMTRTIHDVDQINQMFAESVVPIVSSVFLFVTIAVSIFWVDWRVASAITAILPLAWWLTSRFRYYQRRCYDRIRAIVSVMNTFVQEHLMGAATIRSFGLQQQEEQRFEEINEDHCTAYLETIHHFAFFFAGIDFMQGLALITVFVVLVLFTPVEIGFQAGTYFTFSLYALMVFRPLADLAERYNVLQSAMAAAQRIFHTLDRHREVEDPLQGKTLGPITSIAFENVWFAYENDNWILRGISFSLKKGESVALVGVTGAGKTTILSLLLRFYDYQKGRILINGTDIRDYSLHSLRQQFSVVLQDPVIFSGTLAENVTFSQPDITPEKLDAVLDYVNLRPLVERFPEGWQQHLSEQGKSLSVGEMQLVSLARAVAHDRSFIVLDEATANIDTGTERIIQSALKRILTDKTALVIAHRLSTIKDVTRILVLHQGQVAESGTHTQLLQQAGLYEKLYRLQFP